MNTLQAVRFYILCVYLIVWTRPKLKVYFACLFWSAARTHTLQPGEQRLSCGLYFQRFIIKHVQQFSNCKDGILQQSTDDCLHFRPVAVILNGVYLMFFLASKDYSCVSSRTTSFSSQQRAFVPP